MLLKVADKVATEWPESFRNRLTSPLPNPAEITRLLLEGGMHRRRKGDENKIPVMRSRKLPLATPDQIAITWVGHASFIVQIGGLTVLTDPVWSQRIPGVARRISPPGLAWEHLPPVDAVVISHNHYDHLDAPTIRRLPKDTHIFCPAASGSWFTRRGFRHVAELDWWNSAELVGVNFEFVPAHHWSRRSLRDTCATLWGGWVITSQNGQRVYFAGDTGYGEFFSEIGRRCPGISAAMLPIGAYDPRWFLKSVHMDPSEAIAAWRDVKASHMVSMHWGTFMLTREPITQPWERLCSEWEKAKLPRQNLWDLAVGQTKMLPT